MQKVRLAKHMPHFSTWQEERDEELECALLVASPPVWLRSHVHHM